MQYHNPKVSGPDDNITTGIDSALVLAVLAAIGFAICVIIGAVSAIVWAFVTTLRFVELPGEHMIHWPNLIALALVLQFFMFVLRRLK